MARSSPVRICVIKHIPRREPKFHHVEIFGGVGRSIRELLIILSKGWYFRGFGAIGLVLVYIE